MTFVFGVKCECVAIDHENGTATFRLNIEDRREFVVPIPYGNTETVGIAVGDECWLDLSRYGEQR